ncbi:MAG: iron-containing alcohol dehydrogenase [Atribacterota bacterium]|nr:iron-containing alcohol dehydrogenase [Atribacterota bacterium]MDD5636769.1 iron-containing alcohol dehydrogenase [Atribacterota bacterium]
MKIESIFSILTPSKILIGNNSIENIGEEATKLGANKVLIITDIGIVQAGIIDRIKNILENNNLVVGIFDRVEPEPHAKVVYDCVKEMEGGNYNLLVGIGGGSVIDVTKGVSVLVTNGGKLNDYYGFDKLRKPGLKKIQIPTTAGTGSEVTNVSVLIDENEEKVVIYSPYLFADLAIVDPILTLSMPPKITGHTGMDALCHAIESYTSLDANIFTDTISFKAISLIGRSLRKAVFQGDKDVASRYNMSIASLFAGISFSIAGCNAVHALGLALGGKYHIPHGLSNALMLPSVIEFNLPGNYEKFKNIAAALGEQVDGFSIIESASKTVSAIRRLSEDIGIPQRLRATGVSKEHIEELSKIAVKAERLLVHNPRKLNLEDIIKIYHNAW